MCSHSDKLKNGTGVDGMAKKVRDDEYDKDSEDEEYLRRMISHFVDKSITAQQAGDMKAGNKYFKLAKEVARKREAILQRGAGKKPRPDMGGTAKIIRPTAFQRKQTSIDGGEENDLIGIMLTVNSHQENIKGMIKSYITRELCSIKGVTIISPKPDTPTAARPRYAIEITGFETEKDQYIIIAVAFFTIMDITPFAPLMKQWSEIPESLEPLRHYPEYQVDALTGKKVDGRRMNPYVSLLNLGVWKIAREHLRSFLADLVADFDGNVLKERD
jgi:hypothetical protein